MSILYCQVIEERNLVVNFGPFYVKCLSPACLFFYIYKDAFLRSFPFLMVYLSPLSYPLHFPSPLPLIFPPSSHLTAFLSSLIKFFETKNVIDFVLRRGEVRSIFPGSGNQKPGDQTDRHARVFVRKRRLCQSTSLNNSKVSIYMYP